VELETTEFASGRLTPSRYVVVLGAGLPLLLRRNICSLPAMHKLPATQSPLKAICSTPSTAIALFLLRGSNFDTKEARAGRRPRPQERPTALGA
jgi:hypothetical protein